MPPVLSGLPARSLRLDRVFVQKGQLPFPTMPPSLTRRKLGYHERLRRTSSTRVNHVFRCDPRASEVRRGQECPNRRTGLRCRRLLHWSFPYLETTTMSVADVPRSDETLVLIAITFGGKLWNRCGIEPIGSELKSKQVGVRRRVVFRSINSLMGSVSRLQRRSRICTGGLQVGRPDIRH